MIDKLGGAGKGRGEDRQAQHSNKYSPFTTALSLLSPLKLSNISLSDLSAPILSNCCAGDEDAELLSRISKPPSSPQPPPTRRGEGEEEDDVLEARRRWVSRFIGCRKIDRGHYSQFGKKGTEQKLGAQMEEKFSLLCKKREKEGGDVKGESE